MTDFLLASLPAGPFQRLAALLGDVQPGKPPINLSVGDPAGAVPDFVRAAMSEKAASMGNYPPITGTPEWRAAAARWLNTRFDLGGKIDADKNLLPLAGTGQAPLVLLVPGADAKSTRALAHGWAIPAATDIAFALGVLA